MIVEIINIGSELGFIIPDEVLDELGVKVGDEIEITINKLSGKTQQSELNVRVREVH